MENIEIVRKVEQIKKKSRVGDLQSATFIMSISVDAARMRLKEAKRI